MKYFVKELSNGIRILHIPTKTITAWAGMYIHAGTRDEKVNESGIAHFFEHVLFKGTEKRSAYKILSAIDNSGGELNAYTTKEETFVYASFLKGNLGRASEIITDIVFHSVFPEKEVEKERGVILDEIQSYKDDPVESLFDSFDALYFKNHPLARPILGTEDSVMKIKRNDLLNFVDHNYHTDQMIFCTVGNFTFEKILKYVEPLLQDIKPSFRKKDRIPFIKNSPFHHVELSDVHSAYFVLATEGPSRKDRFKAANILFNNILGGPSLTSILNISLREKHGLTYSVESQINSFTDCGIMSIFLNTEKSKLDKAVSIVEKELKKLRENALSPTKLHTAKRQLKGALALGDDNKDRIIHYMGRSFLNSGTIMPIEEIMKQIDSVTSTDILNIANENFHPDNWSTYRLLPE